MAFFVNERIGAFATTVESGTCMWADRFGLRVFLLFCPMLRLQLSDPSLRAFTAPYIIFLHKCDVWTEKTVQPCTSGRTWNGGNPLKSKIILEQEEISNSICKASTITIMRGALLINRSPFDPHSNPVRCEADTD